MVYEVDGEPIAAVVARAAVKGPATVRLSTALADRASGTIPDYPEVQLMTVQSLRIFDRDLMRHGLEQFPDEASDVDRLCRLGADGRHRGAGPGERAAARGGCQPC